MRLDRRNHPPCPIDLVVHIIGNKWAIPILRDLFTGPKRPTYLLKSLKGISPKTLTDRLREMEESGLIKRTVHAQIPPCVEYSLTPMGMELRELMLILKELGTKWSQRLESEQCPRIDTDRCAHCLVDETAYPCPIDTDSAHARASTQKRRRQAKSKSR